MLKILAFYFLGYNIIQLCNTIFVAFQDTFAQGLTSFSQQFANLVFTVIFWLTASLTLTSYSIAWIVGTVVAIVVGVVFLVGKYRIVLVKETDSPVACTGRGRKKDKDFNISCSETPRRFALFSLMKGGSTLKTHFKYALWVFLVANVANLFGQINQQIVVNVLGTEAAGLFSNFQALLMVFILVVTPLFTLMFPVTTELITKKDTKKF